MTTITVECRRGRRVVRRPIDLASLEQAPTVGHAKALVYAEVCFAIAQVDGHRRR